MDTKKTRKVAVGRRVVTAVRKVWLCFPFQFDSEHCNGHLDTLSLQRESFIKLHRVQKFQQIFPVRVPLLIALFLFNLKFNLRTKDEHWCDSERKVLPFCQSGCSFSLPCPSLLNVLAPFSAFVAFYLRRPRRHPCPGCVVCCFSGAMSRNPRSLCHENTRLYPNSRREL